MIQNDVAENSPQAIAENLTGIPDAWSRLMNQAGW